MATCGRVGLGVGTTGNEDCDSFDGQTQADFRFWKFVGCSCVSFYQGLPLSRTDDCGDYVVVTNARKIVVTGRKADQILYRSHSMYPGGLKEVPYKTMMEKKPDEVSVREVRSEVLALIKNLLQIIRKAVSGMLPKNRLRAKRLDRLFIFPDAEHPYEGNILKDHVEEFGNTFKAARDLEKAPAVSPCSPQVP